MRQGRDNGLLFDDKKNLIGINLGADFCSEHEWGIKRLRSVFGIPDAGYGLTKRSATKIPRVTFVDSKNDTLLVLSDYFELPETAKERENYLARCYLYRGYSDKDGLATAWDEGTFGIRAFKPEDREAVRALHTAIQNTNVAVWLGGGGVFQNAGLVLAIANRIPKDKAQALHDGDVDLENLKKAAEATGIAKRLEAAGKKWLALSPRWTKDTSGYKTKYDVIFWLNPYEQDIHNYGWFTVENLELWATNEGPCMGGRNAEKRG